MRVLNLENYTFSANDQQGIPQLMPYQFKNTLIVVLTHTSLGLNGLELLDIYAVVEKIEKADLEVTLTDDDYHKIIEIFKRFRGFSKNDVQFVKRVFYCPQLPDDGKKVINFSKN